MTELEPYVPAGLPERSGGRLSFLSLAGRITTLTGAALALKEGLWMLRRRMEKDADGLDRLAEQCGTAEVEPRFTALMTDAASALRAVAEASGELAGAADSMEADARAFGDAHEAEYRGVYEAVKASGVQQAKPGFYETR
ncbi:MULTISPECIES: conjugal transfer protein TraB [unclassified Streptomyces]|uniref:conjugal transfer protein TraB n=1 Tax=unclassified Streptomyces TaxID=2593676 RepID=UPI000DAEC181|nr:MULTISPECIES: conjugal transfer protein TraB [unclassified Streptomyces]PZT74497.1 conjugal transfer protein TraB [Streptomyces sp. AC1-42T]PZT82517.1 conjugal transfer protein TraB [Streptomyces sp. AC1-42W]